MADKIEQLRELCKRAAAMKNEFKRPAAPGHSLERLRKRQEYSALERQISQLKAEITAAGQTRQHR